MNQRALGKEGETFAADVLARKGFEIVARNWQAPRNSGLGGEIDIVAYRPDENLLVFVEVKTRRNAAYGEPIEAMGQAKQAQLVALSQLFLQAHPQHGEAAVRFDVIGVLGHPKYSAPVVSHYENVIG